MKCQNIALKGVLIIPYLFLLDIVIAEQSPASRSLATYKQHIPMASATDSSGYLATQDYAQKRLIPGIGAGAVLLVLSCVCLTFCCFCKCCSIICKCCEGACCNGCCATRPNEKDTEYPFSVNRDEVSEGAQGKGQHALLKGGHCLRTRESIPVSASSASQIHHETDHTATTDVQPSFESLLFCALTLFLA